MPSSFATAYLEAMNPQQRRRHHVMNEEPNRLSRTRGVIMFQEVCARQAANHWDRLRMSHRKNV